MTNWPRRDVLHLDAAQGWLLLGDWQSAQEELEAIGPERSGHPEVLKLRVELYSQAKRWDASALVCEGLAKLTPNDPFPYVRAAFALHELKRTREALNVLEPVAGRFPDKWVIPYNLACYTAQLGHLDAARAWFKLAMDRDEEEARRNGMEDPDLKPIWADIQAIQRKRRGEVE